MTARIAELGPERLRRALDGLVPYEPGRPVEEVQRELGLERVVKLASNEGQLGPFPAAREAIARSMLEGNRYPDGGAFLLRAALAERHDVSLDEVTVCAGADAVIGYVCYALLDPGDEAVMGWPSFTSYLLDTRKAGAVPVLAPLREHHLDVDALLGAITARTKLVFVATPNNPTGTMTGRKDLDRFFARVPEHVLTVVDQAYLEYVDDPGYPDAIADYAKQGHRVLVLRTFSKLYGLAGLRVGYGVGPASVIAAIGKVRRPFDVTAPGQAAALASLPEEDEVVSRRHANRASMSALLDVLRGHGLEPAGPAVANFAFVDVGEDAARLDGALLEHGVIVRPVGAFGAPGGLRITAGTLDEVGVLADALDQVLR